MSFTARARFIILFESLIRFKFALYVQLTKQERKSPKRAGWDIRLDNGSFIFEIKLVFRHPVESCAVLAAAPSLLNHTSGYVSLVNMVMSMSRYSGL